MSHTKPLASFNRTRILFFACTVPPRSAAHILLLVGLAAGCTGCELLQTPVPNLDKYLEDVTLIYGQAKTIKLEIFQESNGFVPDDFDQNVSPSEVRIYSEFIQDSSGDWMVKMLAADGEVGAALVTITVDASRLPIVRHINVNVLVDSDGDGTSDERDDCPQDPGKSAPGTCGCGVPDFDFDGNGTADCLEAGAVNLIVEVTQDGAAYSSATVEVRQTDCATGEPFCSGLTGVDGRFTCPDVTTGQTICIGITCCKIEELIGAATRVVVDQGGGAMLVMIELPGT